LKNAAAQQVTGGLRFGVLGPLRVERDGVPVPLPRSAVLRGLLGALLLGGGQPVPPGRLISLVWTDERAVRRQSLQVGICRLREWLTDLAGDGGPVVGHGGGGYHLAVDPAAIDLCRFRDLVAAAAGQGDPARRHDMLERAVGLCRGPVLADLSAPAGADPLLRSADQAVRDATLMLADGALKLGRLTVAVTQVAAIAQAHPLDEPLHARLIDLLAAAGRPAEALSSYEALRARLGEELGVSPSVDVQRAYLAVLAADRVLPPAPRAAAEPVSPPRPSLLPPDSADLVGRDCAADRLCRLLTEPRRPTALPVAAVSGPPGVGKTALAVSVGHRLRDRFPDGQLYVDLRGEGPDPAVPADVLGRFLRALGVPIAEIPCGLDERAELYRELVADRRVLVVLDDAADHAQVRPLLPGGPGCAVLVTARRALPALGSARLRLDVLEDPPALELLGRIAGPERVAAEPAAAAALVEACGRLPLALRIAAGRLARRPHRPVSWLVERLADDATRLDELELDDLAVRPALARGYAGLDAEASRLLRRLALLNRSEFGAWTAAALLDVPDERGDDALERLVEAQLADVAGTSPDGQLRYRLPDLVRAYAHERATELEPAADADAAVGRVFAGWLLRHVIRPTKAPIRGPWPVPARAARDDLLDAAS
jgi:DNA-binding SARP family transcriptional activator